MALRLAHGLLGVECRAETFCELVCRALTPEVREVEGRLLADHVIVEGDDVNPRLPESPEHGLHLGTGHDEVTIHRRKLAPSGKRGPGRKPHRACDLDSVHLPLAADGDLHDAV